MDLNIIVEDDGVRDSDDLIIKKLRRATKLGFSTVALAVRIAPQDVNSVKIPEPPTVALPPDSKMTILSRLTVVVGAQDKILYKITQHPMFKSYSLIAFEPQEDKIFNQITGGSLLCDIVSFDMSQRLPIDIRRANFNVLRLRGTCMEINFTDAFKSQSSRQNTIASAQLLVDKTRGRSIIISSGAKTDLHMRSPHDMAMVSLLFGLNETEGKQCVRKNGLLAIRHSNVRRDPTSIVITETIQESSKVKLSKKSHKSEAIIGEPSSKKVKTV